MRDGRFAGAAVAAVDLGTIGYLECAAAQERLRGARAAGSAPDLLLLLEHPAVFTCGRRTAPSEVPSPSIAGEIPVVDADRGGGMTFHGPGQLVAYPIVSLRITGGDVSDFVRRLEDVALRVLAALGVAGRRRGAMPGVFVGDRKIASVGLRIGRGIATHGIALNSSVDLEPFGRISPCGVPGLDVTSIARELGNAPPMPELKRSFACAFAEAFDCRLEWREASGVLEDPRGGAPAVAVDGPRPVSA